MTDAAPDEQAARTARRGRAQPGMGQPPMSSRKVLAGPNTAREHGIRWGDHWDDSRLTGCRCRGWPAWPPG